MATEAERPIAAAPIDAVPLGARIYGLGSVFGKTMRDSRRATIIVGVVLGLLLIGVSKAIVSEFATATARQSLVDVIAAVPPILQGLAGRPIAVETLGGYISYKYGTFFPLIVSLWSILALSGTLAAEARRGSLEFLATTPLGRGRIALEKLAGHVVSLAIAIFLIFVSIAFVGTAFATLPGDEISIGAAAGYAVWLFLLALAGGSVAFALAPLVGRGAAAGIAGAVVFGGFILNGYQLAIPQLAPFANLTWFGWTFNHVPLAGLYDWASLALVALVTVLLLAAGVVAFMRRDLGATSAVPTPSLPRSLVGLRGPASRATAELIPAAVAWGIGIGVFGLVIAGSGRSFFEQLDKSPDFKRLLDNLFPGVNIGSVGGFLELAFIEFGLILAGLAAATFVSYWASDETSGRLDMLLATPLQRRRWVVSGGVAILAGTVLMVVLAAAGIAIGGLLSGGDLATPLIGTMALGLYAVALGGIGVAIAGVFSTAAAGAAIAILTAAIWLLDVIVPAFGLPPFVHDLALSAHYGQPMLGVWDPVGIVVSLMLAVGGVAVGAWGFGRRDLQG
jgi:ABC-2 type transport system permease protein